MLRFYLVGLCNATSRGDGPISVAQGLATLSSTGHERSCEVGVADDTRPILGWVPYGDVTGDGGLARGRAVPGPGRSDVSLASPSERVSCLACDMGFVTRFPDYPIPQFALEDFSGLADLIGQRILAQV